MTCYIVLCYMIICYTMVYVNDIVIVIKPRLGGILAPGADHARRRRQRLGRPPRP